MHGGLRGVVTAVGALLAATACGDDRPPAPPPPLPDHQQIGFHGDRRKLGWADAELGLPPRAIGAGFGVAWESESFDPVTIGGRSFATLVYASPLFVRAVRTANGPADVVYVATSSGYVYAITAPASVAAPPPFRPGEILFRERLVTPSLVADIDGGVPLGVLSTPVLDADAGRLYVVALDADAGWLAFALDAAEGVVLDGWPIALDAPSMSAGDANGPALFPSPGDLAQRSALALSPTGDRLYVGFGSHRSSGPGWIAAVDTGIAGSPPRVVRAFAAAPSLEPAAGGGIAAAGGPAIDPSGRLWLTTGSSPPGSRDAPSTWGSSLLVLSRDLDVESTYTPYDYCKLDDGALDLDSPLLLPNLVAAQTATPQLAAFGNEQGNVYLLDRNGLRRGADRRPPCEADPAKDGSLLPPLPQIGLGGRGPLNVFGPFSDRTGDGDLAKMRSRPAYFRDGAGVHWLVVSGSHKASVDSTVPVPPGIAKVRVVLTPSEPAHLEVGAVNDSVVLGDPGSPIVTGEKDDAVVWVLDANARPSQALLDPATPPPVLYAFAARDLALLWKSGDGELGRAGRHGVPAVGNGRVYVATDRLTAFAPR